MIAQDRQLLTELAHVNRRVPEFVLAFLDGKISPDEQLAFAGRFVELAEAIIRNAQERKRMVIDAAPNAELDFRELKIRRRPW